MAQFFLDSSGNVRLRGQYANGQTREVTFWSDLSPFAQGYVDALFGELVRVYDTPHGSLTACLHEVAGFSDLAPETLAEILKDCAAWREEFTGKTREASALRADMGREFWRIRQEGKRRTFPPLTPTLGDDGKVYLKPQS